MTAHAMAGDRERCLESGRDEYISKPLQMSALEHTLAALFQTATRPPVSADKPPAPAQAGPVAPIPSDGAQNP
ncbi:MAG: DNA-binding response OmpR family regulator [Pseudohongiellaceae bacterium]|jgi:DNA-binding response OmpR family regulator